MASPLAQIKAVLLTSGVQQTNQPLWQAINQLLDYLIKAENDAAASAGGSSGGGSSAVASQILQLLFQELGQHDDWILIPGPKGLEGIQGILGPPGFDGIDGEDGLTIPCPCPTPVSPVMGPPGMDGLDSGEEPSLLGIPSGLTGSSSATPGGADTEIQINDAGVFGAKAGFEFDPATDIFSAPGLVDLSAAAAGQIKFPSTPNPSSNANTLDEYDEGQWTPTDQSGAGLALTITADNCNFLKMGRLVIVGFVITYPVTASGASAVLGGLPFTVFNSTNAAFGNAFFISTEPTAFSFVANQNTTNFQPLTAAGAVITNATLSTDTIRGFAAYLADV